MTIEQKNHFLTLLIGECWHEGIHPEGLQFCTKCEKLFAGNTDFFSSLSGFDRIRKYMEKEMPEVWEKYLECKLPIKKHVRWLNKILDLSNFIDFMVSCAEEWGWVECEYMKEWPRILPNGGSAFFCEKQCKDKPINCNGGKVKHPALLFAEGVK